MWRQGMPCLYDCRLTTVYWLPTPNSRLPTLCYLVQMKLDILAIGVHPDDVELGCSGTLINEIKRGKKVGIVDLTQGELSTRGSVDSRYEESANAAMIIGATVRENLRMRDGFF